MRVANRLLQLLCGVEVFVLVDAHDQGDALGNSGRRWRADGERG